MSRVVIPILLATAAATGCVAAEGDESFVIVNNLVPEVDEETGAVSFQPSEDGPFFSQGFVNPADPFFFVGSLFESRVTAGEGKESLRTIFVQGANISIEISPVSIVRGSNVETVGAAETIEFQQQFTSAISPNGGLAVGVYDVIPFNVMAAIRGKIGGAIDDSTAEIFVQVRTTTTAFGDFYGDRIDSTSFTFPVIVTNTVAPTLVTP